MEYLRIYQKELTDLINKAIVREIKAVLLFNYSEHQLGVIEGMVRLADAIKEELEPKKEKEEE